MVQINEHFRKEANNKNKKKDEAKSHFIENPIILTLIDLDFTNTS